MFLKRNHWLPPPPHWLLKTNKNSYILLGQQGRGGWESPTQKPPATKHTGSKPNWQGQLQGNGSAVRVLALLSRGKRDSLHGEVRGRHGWLLTFLASSPRVMEGKRSSEAGEEFNKFQLYHLYQSCPTARGLEFTHQVTVTGWFSGKEPARQCRRHRFDP